MHSQGHSSVLPLPVTGCGCPTQPPCHSGSLQWCLQSVRLSGGEQWRCRFDLAGRYPELSGRSAHRCHENAVSIWKAFTCHRNYIWFITLLSPDYISHRYTSQCIHETLTQQGFSLRLIKWAWDIKKCVLGLPVCVRMQIQSLPSNTANRRTAEEYQLLMVFST